MLETFDIVGYCRISVDEELDRDNVSIENQKAIIADFVQNRFPGSSLTFYEDRDRSGYTFEQREGYQAMRKGLLSHKYDILIVKDFSRFSRRNSRGLVELEDLRDAGLRIISVGDGIDFPNDDDWLKIQFQFLINEMPVTDTSKKVKAVVKRRQRDGKWICAAPYGYIVNRQQQFEVVPTEAEIVRKIYELYLVGWGYKRIANYLTDEGIPTPRMSENTRREAAGEIVKREAKPIWAIATVQGILENDFYIGTLRQGKTTRAKINGKQVERATDEILVFENHHQPIVDYRTFATAKALKEQRTTSNFRGVKKNDNVYSGYLECGDCGSPMFAMSRSDLKDAYHCGLYHRRGLKACTSHHIRTETLDKSVKTYVRMVMDSSAAMLEQLNAEIEKQDEDVSETERAAENLEKLMDDLQEELRVTKRQRIRDIMKHPEREELLEETYDELEAELEQKISGLQHQIELTSDKRNTIIRVNRAAKLAMDVFADILEKDKLDRNDLNLVIEKIRVFEDKIEIKLKNDIDTLLRSGILPKSKKDDQNPNISEEFDEKLQAAEKLAISIIEDTIHHAKKNFRVDVINDGDPLEIFTEKDGEVIFKKYSPMGELTEFAGRICEALHKNTGFLAAVCDRDVIIAAAGPGQRDVTERSVVPPLFRRLEERERYCAGGRGVPLPMADGASAVVGAAVPILSQGDLLGGVLLGSDPERGRWPGDFELRLLDVVAAFLGRQMET